MENKLASTALTIGISSISKDGSIKEELYNSPARKKKKFLFFSLSSGN